MNRFELIETHISKIFIGEHDVYKVKKPVNLGFLDYTTSERRKAACEAEVRLNQRLAPGVYLGVVPILVAGEGPPADWAVHMRRLPDEQRADQLLANHQLEQPQIAALAEKLARFHAECACTRETSRFGTRQTIETNLRENFEQAAGAFPAELQELQLAFVRENQSLFETRILGGKIRDGHGDLRLEQIYISPQNEITILDCIEFNDRFRYADVAADLAFLSMDLRYHERDDLADVLLSIYARESNDFDLFALSDFYESYRAFVRGKVALFLPHTPENIETTERYFDLALDRIAARREAPTLYAVGGLIASGKSTVADWLGARLGIPVLSSDRTRKFLARVAPTETLTKEKFPGAYSSDFSRRVYSEMARRAGVVLKSGRSVILDASFSKRHARAQAKELARTFGASFRLLECQASDETCRERLKWRDVEGGVSDARLGLYDQFVAGFEPIRELPAAEYLRLDTAQTWEKVRETLESAFSPRKTPAPYRREDRNRAAYPERAGRSGY